MWEHITETIVIPADNTLDWRVFLTDLPVGRRARVDGAAREYPQDIYRITVSVPDLRLQCDGDCQCLSWCKGAEKRTEKVLAGIGDNLSPKSRTPCDTVLRYSCEKCEKTVKSYVVRFWSMNDVQKIAEWPLLLLAPQAK